MKTFPRPDIEEFFRTYAISRFAVSKDETRIALATNLSGKYNIWGLDLPNTYPYPLTYIDQTPTDMRFDPQGRYILAGFDTDGDENAQLYVFSPSGGALQPVRTAAGRRHMVGTVSKDGNRIYYSSDKENHSFLNSYVYDLNSGEETCLLTGDKGATFLVQVAPDETSFVYLTHYANTFMPAYVQQGDVVRSLVPEDDQVHVVSSVEYVDNQLVFVTNYEADMAYLAGFDLDTGAFSRLCAVEGVDFGSVDVHVEHRTAYIVGHRGVEDTLYTYQLDTGALTSVPLPVAVVEGFHVGDSGKLYLLGRSDVDPFNLYVRDVDGTWTALTTNRVMGVVREQLSTAEVVTFPSFDGLSIEALWFPAHAETANGYTVVWPHGGPQAAERRMFRPFFQFLCSRGYNVWAPNFRGSTGYGASFTKMVERDWGHGPRLDMVESMEWLIREGRAERDKLFLVGGSYGGYMTLLLHGQHADYFQACVDIFGPSNLFSFLRSVPDHWKPAMVRWLGDVDDPADEARLQIDSPITYLDGMVKPMLVIQGANDPRVVKAESDQIVAALRSRGVEVDYLVFDDEGHGFSKKVNEIAAYRRIADFLDAYRK